MLSTWPEIDAVPVTPYYDLRSQLHSGDVLGCIGETQIPLAWASRPIWRGIQRASGKLATHVGMIWKTPEAVLVIEAIARRGVSITALSRLIPGLDDNKYHVPRQDSHLFVLRPQWVSCPHGAHYPGWAQREAIKEALRHEGMDYPESVLPRLLWAMWTGLTRLVKNRLVCSEHVSMSLAAGGVTVPPDLPLDIRSPGACIDATELVGCLWHPER